MRVVLDGRLYHPRHGGIARYTSELVKNLLTIDQETIYYLFVTPDDLPTVTVKAPNLRVVTVPITHYTVVEQLKMAGELAKVRPDVVHFLNFNHPLLYRGKFITTIHDLTMHFFPVANQRSPLKRIAYLATMKHAATAARAVIVPTKAVKNDVVTQLHAKPEKVQVIYEGVAIPQSVPTSPKKEYLKNLGVTKPYLLFVSQWRPHKGLPVLVEAFETIRRQNSIQLVVTGQPNQQFPAIPAAIAASVNRADIITPGFVDDATLDALYAGAELFVFPSLYEGFGLPPLEAMARGVAVAASNTSVMPEILGQAAAYFDPRDPANIAKVISETLADKNRLKELKNKGLHQAAKYSWQKMAEETLALYRRVNLNR